MPDQANSIQSIGASLASYEVQNFPASSSPCPKCSSNGHCELSELYQKEVCVCDPGWIGDSCSISESDAKNLEDITLKVLDQVQAAFTKSKTMWLTTTAQTQAYLQTILDMTTVSYRTTTIISRALKLISDIVQSDYSLKSTSDVFDTTKMTIAAQTVDKCMSFVFSHDCYLQDESSKYIYSEATKVLDNLGVLMLWQKPADSKDHFLNTDDFDLYASRVNAADLATKVISMKNQPQVSLGGSGATTATGEQDLHIIFWKTNLFVCPQIQKQNKTATPVSIAVTVKDSTTPSPAASSISAQISYPITDDSQAANLNCATGCQSSIQTGASGQKFLKCECQSIADLSSNNQLAGVFENSNLYKLISIAALATYDYLASWVFWLLMALASWYILTVVAIRFRIIRPLQFKNRYSAEHNKRRLPISLSRMKLSTGFCRSIFYGLKVVHLI